MFWRTPPLLPPFCDAKTWKSNAEFEVGFLAKNANQLLETRRARWPASIAHDVQLPSRMREDALCWPSRTPPVHLGYTAMGSKILRYISALSRHTIRIKRHSFGVHALQTSNLSLQNPKFCVTVGAVQKCKLLVYRLFCVLIAQIFRYSRLQDQGEPRISRLGDKFPERRGG